MVTLRSRIRMRLDDLRELHLFHAVLYDIALLSLLQVLLSDVISFLLLQFDFPLLLFSVFPSFGSLVFLTSVFMLLNR